MARTVVLEATAPPAVDWSAARIWRVIVTVRGRPCAAFWAPGPGRLRDPDRFTRALLEPGTTVADYEREYERFRGRMGMAPRPAFRRPTCTLVVCTHRRSAYLPGLLEAVGRLDPQPDEFVVVDNDPGAQDSRAEIEAAGATYVREDRRGLDHARTAGLRAARGELVAFTDDDCVPAVSWLADLGELFAAPAVAAVTGPAFAWELESPAQLRFELEGGFSRGLRRRNFDWTVLSPLDAGAVGAGANMIFRRSVLDAMGDPFPGELDAGTATQSGGDMYALYRALAAGHRVVYDPGTYVFHRHRRDPSALHHAFWGYGVGLSAVMAKLLAEEREPSAVTSWMWLWRQYRSAVLWHLAGKADARHVRVAWDYLRGGFAGPRAWRAARRELGSTAPAQLASRPPADTGAASTTAAPQPATSAASTTAARRTGAATPAISVVVPTAGRPDALERCLAALAQQRGAGDVEIVVVDDGVPPAAVAPRGADQLLRSGGRGAAAARNLGARAARGRLLLFLDDDLVPAPDLVARHLDRHGEQARAVVGYCPPGPPDAGLAEQAAALWWHDHFELMGDSAALTFTGMLSGNLSLPRSAFLELGGFDEDVGRLRREDWLFGLVALEAGLELVYAPDAVAVHEFRLPVRRRLRAAYAEGRGDALLIAHRPELERLLERARPFAGLRPTQLAIRTWVHVAARPRTIAAAGATLELLERARLRRPWLRGFQAAQASAYAAGRRAGAPAARRAAARTRLPVVVAESDEPLAPPGAFAGPFGLLAGSAPAGSDRARPRHLGPLGRARGGGRGDPCGPAARPGAGGHRARGGRPAADRLRPWACSRRGRAPARHRHAHRPRRRAGPLGGDRPRRARSRRRARGRSDAARGPHTGLAGGGRGTPRRRPRGDGLRRQRAPAVGRPRAVDARTLRRAGALPDGRRPVPVPRRPPRPLSRARRLPA